MSYCRWSSDDFQCDAYVWHDVSGGWRTEIAGRRRVWKIDLPPEPDLPVGEAHSHEREAWSLAYVTRYYDVMTLMRDETNWEWLDLPTPEGGNSYWHETPQECAENLLRLREQGFNVPQSAIDALMSEATPIHAPELAGGRDVRGEGLA